MAKPCQYVDGQPQRGHPVCPVRVGRDNDTSSQAQYAQRLDSSVLPVEAGHRPRIYLHRAPHPNLALDHAPAGLKVRQGALRVRHDNPEAALTKFVRGGSKCVIEAAERRLKQ